MNVTSYLRAAFSLFVVVANTLLAAVPLYVCILAKLLLARVPRARLALTRTLTRIAETWVHINSVASDLLQRIHWDLEIDGEIDPQGAYLVVSNHRSYVDIPLLQKVFDGRAPLLRFFIKDQLKWVPILGQAWWALDFPFMKRYSRQQIEKHPELRGRDVEATRRACRRLQGMPVAILNFVEGTRFTPEKHAAQQSPYRHLLRPRAGGLAYALAAMEGRIRSMIDVTIVYPQGTPRFGDLLTGRLQHVRLRAVVREIPEEILHSDYENDPDDRRRFQQWLGDLWQEKDRQIASLSASDASADQRG